MSPSKPAAGAIAGQTPWRRPQRGALRGWDIAGARFSPASVERLSHLVDNLLMYTFKAAGTASTLGCATPSGNPDSTRF